MSNTPSQFYNLNMNRSNSNRSMNSLPRRSLKARELKSEVQQQIEKANDIVNNSIHLDDLPRQSPAARSKSFIAVKRNSDKYTHDDRRESLPTVRFTQSAIDNSPEAGVERKLKKVALSKAKEGRWNESVKLLVNVLKLQKGKDKIDQSEIANTKYHIAHAFYRIGNEEYAMRFLSEALDVMLQQKNKKYALDLASALFLTAVIEEGKGNIDAAKFYIEETQKVEVTELGYTSKKTCRKMEELRMSHSFTPRFSRKVATSRAA